MPRTLHLIVPFLLAAGISLALTPLVRLLAIRIGAVDQPDQRKVHKAPMPILGGVAVLASLAMAGGLLRLIWPGHIFSQIDTNVIMGTALGVVPVVLTSLWDDLRTLPAWPRFLAQATGAAIAVSFGVSLAPTVHIFDQTVDIGVFAIPLSMLWIVGVTNAFNLVDGLDGLSAGLALVSAGSLAAVFSIAHQPAMAAATLIISGALVGFLPYNLYPARIFLGDTGAASIGFFLACFALRGGSTLSSGLAAIMPVFLMGLPIADTAVAMLRRSLGRLQKTGNTRVFQADRNHFHHRLLALGIDHRRAVFILYGAGMLVAAVGLLSVLVTAFEAGLLLMGLTLAGFLGIARLGYTEFAVVRNGLVLKFYEAPVLRRSFFGVFADVAIVLVSIVCAVALKFDTLSALGHPELAVKLGSVLVPTTVIVFWGFKLYRGAWRLAGIEEYRRLGVAIVAASFFSFLLHGLMFATQPDVVVSVLVIHTLLMLLLAGGARVSYRMFVSQRAASRQDGIPVLIYGAGFTGGRLLPQLLGDGAFGMRPVGFIDDDPEKEGKLVNGIPVWGDWQDIARAVERTQARRLVLASRNLPPGRVVLAKQECARLGVEVLQLAVGFDQVSDGPGDRPLLASALPKDTAVAGTGPWLAASATPPRSVLSRQPRQEGSRPRRARLSWRTTSR